MSYFYSDEIEEIYEDTPVIPDELSDEAEMGNVPSIADLMPAYMRAFGQRLAVEDRGTWERVVLNKISPEKDEITFEPYEHPQPPVLERGWQEDFPKLYERSEQSEQHELHRLADMERNFITSR